MKNKTIILSAILITISFIARSAAEQCTQEQNIYKVSMKYVDYDDLTNSRLPLRERFNKNEEDVEDQALEYQNNNDDIIITVNRTSYDKTGWTLEDETIQILDDTGLYTSHFLIQGLMKQALENGETEIDPNDEKYKKQVTIIKKQLKKLKALVNTVATYSFDDLFESGKDAEDVEDNIGNEWGEGDGVLDILDNTSVHIAQLSMMWTTLLQNISKASDIHLQAYQHTKQATNDIQESELYSTWSTLSVPEVWKYTSPESLVPRFLINASNRQMGTGLGIIQEQSAIVEEIYAELDHQLVDDRHNSYYRTTGALKALVLNERKEEYCSSLIVSSDITGKPRDTIGRFKQYFKE